MLNKEIIKRIMKTHKEPMNWVIITNVAVGRGINGVTYETYFGHAPGLDCNGECEFEADNDCVVITQVCKSANAMHRQENTIILPWENIVCIKFFPMSQTKYTTYWIDKR